MMSIFMFFGMWFVSSPEKYFAAAQKDVDNVYVAYGKDAGAEIINNANSAFELIFGASVIDRTANVMHNTPKKEAATFGVEQKAALQSNKMLRTMRMQIYALFLRMSIAARWIPVLLVLGAAAFVDGLVERKIKIEGYGFTSPGIQARMTHILVALTGASVIMTYLPVNLPILWWPIATFITVLCIRFVASNVKQVTT